MTTRAEELKAIVDDAWAATETLAESDSSIRQTAFEQLLTHLLANGVLPATNGPGDSRARQTESPDASYATAAQRAEAVGRFLRVAPDDVHQLFDLACEFPHLRVPSEKLPRDPAEAIRAVALLLCAARTALGLETDSADIYEDAEERGHCYSSFPDLLANIQELSLQGKSSSGNRLVRLRVVGIEAAQALAASLID